MSARNFFFILLIIPALPVYSQGNTALNLNVGNIGIGGNFSLNDDYNLEGIVTLLNIGIENTITNTGFEFSPFKYFSWSGKNEEDNVIKGYSFANLNIYWNVLNLQFQYSGIYFGPFASINYLFLEEEINWKRYVFTGGIQMGFRANFERLNYNIISFELGYRNIDGRGKYFIGAKMDIAIFIASLIYITAARSSDD